METYLELFSIGGPYYEFLNRLSHAMLHKYVTRYYHDDIIRFRFISVRLLEEFQRPDVLEALKVLRNFRNILTHNRNITSLQKGKLETSIKFLVAELPKFSVDTQPLVEILTSIKPPEENPPNTETVIWFRQHFRDELKEKRFKFLSGPYADQICTFISYSGTMFRYRLGNEIKSSRVINRIHVFWED